MPDTQIATDPLRHGNLLPNPLPHLYRWYRRARPAHRAIARTAQESERFRREAWSWSEPDRGAWILRALRGVLVEAAAGSPFYRERLAAAGIDPATVTFDGFARLAPLDRDALAAESGRMQLLETSAAGVIRDSTGGSTGQPTVVWKGALERGWREGGGEFFMRRAGIPFGARTAYLWGHHLDASARDGWTDRLRHLRDNVVWLDCFRLSPGLLLDHHARLNRLRPDCVIAYGGALAELARVVETSGMPPRYPRVAFVTGAEKVWAHERERIERVFGKPLFERYGSRDVGLMAFQAGADASRGFEVDWPNMLVEPETDEEESNLLVTKLHADAFPLIGYRIGDRARFPRGSRPGTPVVRLEEILGRVLEMVRVGPERWVSGATFPHMFKDYPVADSQVYQAADGSVEVRVVTTSAAEWTDEVHRRFTAALERVLGETPLHVKLVAEIPRTESNKRRPVISELARSRS